MNFQVLSIDLLKINNVVKSKRCRQWKFQKYITLEEWNGEIIFVRNIETNKATFYTKQWKWFLWRKFEVKIDMVKFLIEFEHYFVNCK